MIHAPHHPARPLRHRLHLHDDLRDRLAECEVPEETLTKTTMPPPTREQVNALIMRLKDTTSSGGLWVLMPEVVQVLTALQAENDRLRAQASPAWVAIKDRKPTKEDADQHGDILGLWPDRKHATIQWHHFADGRGSLGSYWQRLPAPPESAADRQRREDEEAFQKFMANGACKIDRCIWEAALAHARKEATP